MPGEPSQVSHLLLVNPSAGGGRARRRLPMAEAALNDAGLTHRTVLTRSVEHGCEEAAAAALDAMTVIVMSGDGLIGQVGGVLAGTDAVMAVIPGGRGNDFARVVGIPDDVEEAVGLIAAGTTRQIDVGAAGESRFLCIASCGFDSDANRIANEAKHVKGPLVYAYAAIRALAAWKPATFTLTVDGSREEVTGYTIAVGNSKAYGGGMFIAPDAELDDGALDVVAIEHVSKPKFLRRLPDVFKGRHVDSPEVSVRRGAAITIEADRPFTLYADGDAIEELPVSLSVLPRALTVVVPPPDSPG